MSVKKQGVLLINLGTPDEPTPKAVKQYLLDFLSDQRVIDYPKWLWQIILRGIILNVRPRKVAEAYQSIWTEEGSPLRSISYQQRDGLSQLLNSGVNDSFHVELAMTYGNPDIASAMKGFSDAGVDDVVVLPLYPQYSATTTAAAFDALASELKNIRNIPSMRFIRQYCHYPEYIKVLADSVRDFWQQSGEQNTLLFSFHGIPKRYVTLGDPYQANCEQTARDVAKELGLSDEQWLLCYQSRVGREEWLQPYTDKTLEELPEKGTKAVDVICPAFSVDCLETLEEIAVENKEVFMEAGGENYRYIPALNASQPHLQFLANLIREYSFS